jgi:hypothetical protein
MPFQDATAGVLFLITGIAIAASPALSNNERLGGGALFGVLSLVTLLGANDGFGAVNRCREARDHFDASHRDPVLGAVPAIPPAERIGTGFFCTSSPTRPQIGRCTRDQTDCEHVKGGLAAIGYDVAPCIPINVAVCVDENAFGEAQEVCATTSVSCAHRRDDRIAIAGVEANITACEDRN